MSQLRLRRRKKNVGNTLPIILFLVVLINYIPLIKLNIATKKSFAVDVIPMALTFGIEIMILFFFYLKKIKLTKKEAIHFVLLTIINIVALIIQIINYRNNDYKILDFANIACKFINMTLLFIFAMNLKIDEKYLNNFMIAIVIMGIVACIQNMILYSQDILANLKIIEVEKNAIHSCKSFFSQKNPYAFFLYVSIISTIFLFQKESKIRYKIILVMVLILFLFNLVFTFSRTGTAMTILFLVLWFLFTNKIKIVPKIILSLIGIFAVIGCINLFNEYNPELFNRLLRLESVETFTGRTKFWDIAEAEIFSNKLNLLFGYGRFKAEALIEKFRVTQFHNTYIEFLVSGGILELVYFIAIYLLIIINMFRSDMDKKYKSIYFSMFVSYAIYMCFESLGRFSIGCSDTLCLIFFVTIPVLHINSNKEKKIINEGELRKVND